MALETNLNTNPYWDDYNENKNFQRILFKPGLSVQTRELNQLQSIIQNQVERFGDHVFKSGTIVSGINFDYNPLFPYIKILDITEDNAPVTPTAYLGLYLRNSSNLQALICKYEPGFESKDPDLNTLYLKYLNSGSSLNSESFSSSELLEIFNKNYQLFKVNVNNGGLGFSNSDILHIVPALTVNVASGTFQNNEIVTQSNTGARAQIVGIYNDPYSPERKILSIKPLNSEQLANSSANSLSWYMESGLNLTGNTSSAVANVLFSVGEGARGLISTDSLGVVQSITLSSGGTGYTTLPQAVIKPSSITASVSTLDLSTSDIFAKVRVAGNAYNNPVGYGYGFSVTPGVIYQKGVFCRVDQQSLIVSKYNSTPNNVMVGFKSNESIVTYTSDSSLYDNAANTLNENAPGADRLAINPVLYAINSDEGSSNSEFFPLVEFVNGLPAKENRDSSYNKLAREFERRTFETAGNFVINPFTVYSKEKLSNNSHISMVVNPGTAYISGKRIQTNSGILVDVAKANTTRTDYNVTLTANYGNYVRVNEIVGEFQFNIGAEVDLYDTAHRRLTNVTIGASSNITPTGNKIGVARIRSLVYDSGVVGTPKCTFRMYLFDIEMNAGKNFRDVRSVYFNSTHDGICDTITENDPSSNSVVTYLYNTESPDIIFKTSLFGVKSISNLSYIYRTSNNGLTLYANGSLDISDASHVFPYGGSASLSNQQKKDFVIFPTANVQAANSAGSVACGTSTPNLVGTSTTFVSDYKVGDYIKIQETGGYSTDVKRIENIVNNTLIILNQNCSFTDSNANVCLFFPALYPINFERNDRTILTDPTPSTVRINIGNSSLLSSVNVVANYNLKIPNASQINKDLNRDLYVKIYTGNNNTISSGNNTYGPWSLGIPDVFRLKNVYFGNTTSSADVTQYFYINSQDDGDKVKNAHLVLKKNSALEIPNNQWLLVKFDAFDVNSSEGYITRDSYTPIVSDSAGFNNNLYINSLEIPEVLTSEGRYYDTIDCIDFRPYCTNTAVFSNTVASATINPANSQTINTDEKYFPLPDSEIILSVEYYLPRIDNVYVTSQNEVRVSKGNPDTYSNLKAPPKSIDSLTISNVYIPPYPSIPYNYSNTTFSILDKKVGNDFTIVNLREDRYKIKNITNSTDRSISPRAYSMTRINSLEKRIQAIEKELLLNKLEASIIDKVIPSSNNPAQNRFKNGFLVDGFDNFNVVNLSNPENCCYIDTEKSELVPCRFTYNIENIFDRSDANTISCISGNQFISLPYNEVPIIRQLNASKPGYIEVTSNTSPNVVTNNAVKTYPEPIINAPTLIREDQEFRAIISRCQPGEYVPYTGSYNWDTGAFLSATASFYADAGGTIEYYEPDWEAGPGIFSWTFTFTTSGFVKTLTTRVTPLGQIVPTDNGGSSNTGGSNTGGSNTGGSNTGGSSGGGNTGGGDLIIVIVSSQNDANNSGGTRVITTTRRDDIIDDEDTVDGGQQSLGGADGNDTLDLGGNTGGGDQITRADDGSGQADPDKGDIIIETKPAIIEGIEIYRSDDDVDIYGGTDGGLTDGGLTDGGLTDGRDDTDQSDGGQIVDVDSVGNDNIVQSETISDGNFDTSGSDFSDNSWYEWADWADYTDIS